MLQTDILTSFIAYVQQGVGLFAPIRINRLPPERGISAEITSGRNAEVFLNGRTLQTITVLFLSKSNSQQEALEALFAVCNFCTAQNELPNGIINIEISSTPSFVDRENESYIYSSLIGVSYVVE